MTKMIAIKQAILMSALAYTSSASAFEITPPKGSFFIEDIGYNGSGCPLGTVLAKISPDGTSLYLEVSEFYAEAGPGISIRDGRKNCQVSVNLATPPGWQYSLKSIDVEFYSLIEDGITASYSTSYYFQGSFETARFQISLNGPLDEEYDGREIISPEDRIWSPCGVSRALNINTAISVRNTAKKTYPYSQGIIGVDSFKPFKPWHLIWRRCSK